MDNQQVFVRTRCRMFGFQGCIFYVLD